MSKRGVQRSKKYKKLPVQSWKTDDKISFNATGNPLRTLQALNDLRATGEFCDVEIKVQEKTLWAHRAILAVNSEYFRLMFSIKMKENLSNTVTMDTLEESDFSILEALIEFMYTGKAEVDMNSVADLFAMSDMLQMDELKESCADQLVKNLCESNSLGMYSFAKQFSIDELKENALNMIKKRFAAIVKTEAFTDLDSETMLDIVKLDDLRLGHRKEDEVVYGVIRWLMHEPAGRCKLLMQTFPYIRWSEVSETCLNYLKSQEHLKTHPDLVEELESHMKMPTAPRSPTQSIYVIGGYLQSRTGPRCPQLTSVHTLSFSETAPPAWDTSSIPSIPFTAPHAFAFNMAGKLLCFLLQEETRGEYRTAVDDYVGLYEYSETLGAWERRHTQSEVERGVLTSLHACVYNRGALRYDAVTARIHGLGIEAHFCARVTADDDGDVTLGAVTSLAQNAHFVLNTRGDFALEVAGDAVYAIGGADAHSRCEVFSTAEVHRFSLTENSWTPVASMHEKRSQCASVYTNNCIYVMGGFEKFRSSTLESYSTTTDQWTQLSSMDKPRTHFSAVCLQGKIIVLGGKSYSYQGGGARKVLRVCESYDISSDTWSMLPEMLQPRCAFPAVVL